MSPGPTLEDGSSVRDQIFFQRLVARGIESHHTVVDYGCGTLRLGKHCIRFLDSGRYYGLDIDQRVIDVTFSALQEEFKDKHPALRVINDATISEVASARPDWIFSKGVVQHVPPGDLVPFFNRIRSLCHQDTRVVARVSKLATEPLRRANGAWSHSLPFLKQATEVAGLRYEFEWSGFDQGLLLLSKS